MFIRLFLALPIDSANRRSVLIISGTDYPECWDLQSYKLIGPEIEMHCVCVVVCVYVCVCVCVLAIVGTPSFLREKVGFF